MRGKTHPMPQDTGRQIFEILARWLDAIGLGPSFLIAAVGQFAYHSREVTLRRPGPSLWRRAIFGFPSAFLAGVIADAAGTWLSAPAPVTHGLAGVFGWLGPAGIQALAMTLLRRGGGLSPTGPKNEEEQTG
jgi:hypothetical protein